MKNFGWKRSKVIQLICLLGFSLGSAVTITDFSLAAQNPAANSDLWISGFWTARTATHYPAPQVDVNSITHLVLAFISPLADGTLDNGAASQLNASDAITLSSKMHAVKKKAILSIGGANSGDLFRAATKPSNFDFFVKNLIQLMNRWNFDGLDIDWESIHPNDYATILKLAHSIKLQSPNALLTIDITRGNSNQKPTPALASFYESIGQLFDQVNLMTYQGSFIDLPGWVVWHSSPLYGAAVNHPYSIASSVQQLIDAGIPNRKIGLGIGFFGSCWNAPVTAPLQNLPAALTCSSVDYSDIINQYIGKMSYYFDDIAKVPYLSSIKPVGKCGCTYISYENKRSIQIKSDFLHKAGLGGVILWDLNSGHAFGASDPDSLLHSVWKIFSVSPSENTH